MADKRPPRVAPPSHGRDDHGVSVENRNALVWLGVVRSSAKALAALALAGLLSAAAPLVAWAAQPDSVLRPMLQAAARGDWQAAHRAAADLGPGSLRTYVRWRELLDRADRLPFTAYAQFLRHETDWPRLGQIQARAEEAIDGTVTLPQRLAFFAGRTPRTRQGRVGLAEALHATGRQQEAARLIRQSWREDSFPPAEETLLLQRFGSALDAEDHVARVDRLLWDGQVGEARRMLPRVDMPQQRLVRARLALQLSEPTVEQALAAVPSDLRRHPGLLFDRLQWRKRHGIKAGAREILLDPPADLGQPERWWREQQAAIREGIGERSFKSAYRLAAVHRQQNGVPFAEAEWLAGWLALRFAEQPGLAAGHFERMWRGVGTPISRSRAAYWSGRAAAARDQTEAASSWYAHAAAHPNTFYGQLAAVELGEEPGQRLVPATTVATTARKKLSTRTPARLAKLFCDEGEPGAAQPFFRHLGFEAAAQAEELGAVIELARQCGRADLVLAAARAATGNGGTLVSEAYPVPRMPVLREVAPELPEPALVLAVARQESLFDPAARSPAGALGLMQLMPSTAALVARAAGIPFSRSSLAADPAYNVRLGSLYLQQQLQRYGGEPALALAAYNAGPGRVSQWMQLHGDPRGDDPYRLIDWIELIPFAETRNYVQRVLEGRTVYRAVLAGPKAFPARTAADTAPLPRLKPAT